MRQLRQYLYVCTSKASKLSTCGGVCDREGGECHLAKAQLVLLLCHGRTLCAYVMVARQLRY